MPHFVAVGGAYKLVRSSFVGQTGAWRRVIGRWKGVGGVWKRYYTQGEVQLEPATVHSFDYSPDVPQAEVSFIQDGSAFAKWTDQTIVTYEAIQSWFFPLLADVGAGFEIRAIQIGGIPGEILGDDLDTWLSLATYRNWAIHGNAVLNRTRAVTIEVQIRPVGGDEPVAFAEYTLSVMKYDPSNPNGSYGRGGGTDLEPPNRFNIL